MRFTALTALPALLACCSCNHYTEYHYAAHALAIDLGAQVEDPALLHASAVPPDLPGMVLYARIRGDFASGSEARQAKSLKMQAIRRDLQPDVLVFAPAGSVYSGSTSQYIGFGVGISTPNYRPQADLFCYRLTPCSLGLYWNDNLMLTSVVEATRGESGIQEGDTLVSINGQTVERSREGSTPFDSEALRLRVGDRVKLIWIRPGTGRMEGVATAAAARPLPANLPVMDTSRRRRR